MKILYVLLLLSSSLFADNQYTLVITSNTVASDGKLVASCTKNGVTVSGPTTYTFPIGTNAITQDNMLREELRFCVIANDGMTGEVKESNSPPPIHGSALHDSTVPTSTDPRFSDARTPLAHVHPESDVTNLTTDLAAKSVNIGKGTATFSTTAITAGACSATVTVAASGVLTSDVIHWSYASAPTASTDARLNINMWPTANNVNFNRCNTTASSITPTAIVMNWQVTR